MKLAVIDLDTIAFIVAYKQVEAGNRDNKDAVKNHIKEYISTILLNSRADYVSMVYQVKEHFNFRKFFYPDYKANRPPTPEFMIIWKEYILDVFKEMGAIGVKVIESDDVNCIAYYKFKDTYEVITVTSDKDAKQIPGLHYNPRTHTMIDISEANALRNLWIQVLMGDSTDNVNGIEGVGIKTAEKIVKDCITPNDYWISSYKAYMEANKEKEWYPEISKNLYLVRLLKKLDMTYYPFNEEVTELFNIIPSSDLVISNLFY